MATYLAARLAHDSLAERGIPQPVRAERATNAKTWLATLALPVAIRSALIRLIEASGEDPAGVATPLRGVIAATSNRLDRAAKVELDRLAEAFVRP